MNNQAKQGLKNVASLLYEEKIQDLNKLSWTEKDLSNEEILVLARKIQDLPYTYQAILKAKFIFQMTPSQANTSLDLKDSKNLLSFVIHLLSKDFFPKGQRISSQSIKKALVLVQEKELAEDKLVLDNNLAFHPSKAFEEKIKALGIKTRNPYRKILKTAASFLIVLLASLIMFFSINVEARQKLFDWIIKDFGSYSSFTPEIIDPQSSESINIDDLKILYIPKDFELVEEKIARISKIILYKDKNNEDLFFYIKLKNFENSNSINLYDTEDAVLEEIFINGNKAYYWTHETNMLLWQQDNIECFISGSISKDQIIKIAENISK
ncbi:MAG: DUF4367 domain-containing protein [Bacillota bacterium]|nr:DUF4367 domain-containing protein [Bacillota bacterium]